MNTKELSIIIVNFNTFHLTSTCMRSIYKYVKGVDFEIILVDNASEECPARLFKEEFPDIHLIESRENLGFAKGNNLGVLQARGDFILLLNSDTELTNGVIQYALHKMRNEPKIGVLSSKLIYPDGRIQHAANRFPSIQLEILELFRINKLMVPSKRANVFLGFFFNHLSEKAVDWVWGTFFLTRNEIIQEFPQQKLPDDFFMYYEDVQWCYWIKKMGYTILYDPTYPVIHHLSSSSPIQHNDWERTLHKMKQSTQNEIIFLKSIRGSSYVYVLFLLRAAKYLSLRDKKFRKTAAFYWKLVINRLDTSKI